MTMTLKIEKVNKRALLLHQRATESPVQPQLLDAAIKELSLVLEELQTSEEELHQQNQALIATRLEVEAERQRYQDLFDFAPQGYLVTDKFGCIQEANIAIAEMLGCSQDFLMGKPFVVLLPESRRTAFLEILAQLNQPYRSDQMLRMEREIQILPRHRPLLDVKILVSATYNTEGNVLRLLWSLQDITQQKQTSQILEQLNSSLDAQVQVRTTELTQALETADALNQVKREFMATMSHELRTPLNVILGTSESLLEFVYGEINDRQRKAIVNIESSGYNLLELINDILDLGNSEVGEIKLNPEAVEVIKLCKFCLNQILTQATSKQIQVFTNFPNNLGKILVDEQRLRQILLNLLSNAVKFTPGPGQIILNVQLEPAQDCLSPQQMQKNHDNQRGNFDLGNLESLVAPIFEDLQPQNSLKLHSTAWIVFQVKDTGIGIAAADLGKLFQPFVQLDSRLNRRYSGTGLGLALVKHFTELHGGEVSVESVLGQGSCFTVRLPYTP